MEVTILFLGLAAGYNNTSGTDNTAVGSSAGSGLTTGNRNVHIGTLSGINSDTPDDNIAIGYSAGRYSEGNENVFIGSNSGYTNDTGHSNTFMGFNTGYSNTTGYRNAFLGHSAGYSNTTGRNNTFLGYESGYTLTSGSSNLFMGNWTGYFTTNGSNNIFLGNSAGYRNTTGDENIFLGDEAGYYNTTGYGNIFLGTNSGYRFTDGRYNICLGHYAGRGGGGTMEGDYNVFIGHFAGGDITTGTNNTFVGRRSGQSISTGEGNVFMGEYAGYNCETGSYNVFLGSRAGYNETGSDRLYIDNSDTINPLIYGEFDNDLVRINGDLESTSQALIGGIAMGNESTDQGNSIHTGKGFTTTPWLYTNAIEAQGERGDNSTLITVGNDGNYGANDEIHFVTNGNGRMVVKSNGRVGIGETNPGHPLHMGSGAHCTSGGVGTNASDISKKYNITELDYGLEEIMQMTAAAYYYKSDSSASIGFIAQEMEQIIPEVVSGEDGEKGIAYGLLTAVLVKGIQEQQNKIQELEAQLQQLTELRFTVEAMQAKMNISSDQAMSTH